MWNGKKILIFKGLLHYDPPMRAFLVLMTCVLVTVFASQTVLASQHHHAEKERGPFARSTQHTGHLHCVHNGHQQGKLCPHVNRIPTEAPVECRLISDCGGPFSGLPLSSSSSSSSFWAELSLVQLEGTNSNNTSLIDYQSPEQLVFDPAIPPPQHF